MRCTCLRLWCVYSSINDGDAEVLVSAIGVAQGKEVSTTCVLKLLQIRTKVASEWMTVNQPLGNEEGRRGVSKWPWQWDSEWKGEEWPESSHWGWGVSKKDTYSLPGLGETANTRIFCREHSVPLRNRFLLEKKMRKHQEKKMTIEGICSLWFVMSLGSAVKISWDQGRG